MSGPADQGVEKTAQPTLCSAGCGFYSNSGPGGMCSKCSREAQAREGKLKAASNAFHEAAAASSKLLPASPVPAAPTGLPGGPCGQATPLPSSAAAPMPPVALPSTSAVPAAAAAPPAKPPSPTRCLMCNKKVGLTGFSCKCNPDAVFCASHRYAEAHACTFDYKAAQAKQLAENNPVVMAAKLNKF